MFPVQEGIRVKFKRKISQKILPGMQCKKEKVVGPAVESKV